jgi:hypothetical protein
MKVPSGSIEDGPLRTTQKNQGGIKRRMERIAPGEAAIEIAG